jgi:hypothetical protein
MYESKQIKQLFGDDVLKYLTNKNRGGVSSEKGNTYENFFAVYQLAVLSREVIENNREVDVYSQILAFVDDLIVDRKYDFPLQHYQLKNSQSETWGSELKSIRDDFSKQYELNRSRSRESELYLVVSLQELKTKLEENLPTEISAYSQVIHFPYQSDIVKVLAHQPTFRNAIKYLCAFENPEPDKIECVATVLLGAWVSSDKSGISVKDILEKAQKCQPSYIRSFSQQLQLDPTVENILNEIPNFSYNLTKGFLHWEYGNGLEQGTLPYSIDSKKFNRFEAIVKKNQPTSFEEIEPFLI